MAWAISLRFRLKQYPLLLIWVNQRITNVIHAIPKIDFQRYFVYNLDFKRKI